MAQALENITILDLTHMLAGPFATMVLTDLGAETIKIEPTGRGEATRQLLADDPVHSVDGMGAYFMTLNRGKKSVSLDLKSPQGHALFYRLVEKADVVVDNFSPGVAKRLGIDHAALSAVNPRIVTCSVSGFGQTGPGAGRTAFDLVAQAMGGGMSITGEQDGRALRAGIPIGDLGGGLFAAIGILAAIRDRDTTGKGQAVDISMLDCQISLLNYMATMYLMSGEQPARLGNAHFAHVPYDTFATQTRDIVVCILTDAQWSAFAMQTGLPENLAQDFATRYRRLVGRDELLPVINDLLKQATCEHWLEVLGQRGIPCAPVNDFAHALADPQVLHRNMVREVPLPGGKSARIPGNPVKLSAAPEPEYSAPPLLGQHTRDVLRTMCALSEVEIDRLSQDHIVDDGSRSGAMAADQAAD